MTKRTIAGPGSLRIDLDPTQCYPDDPGAGTPVILRMDVPRAGYEDDDDPLMEEASCTWGFYLGDGTIEDYPVPNNMKQWLESVEGQISNWLDKAFDLAAGDKLWKIQTASVNGWADLMQNVGVRDEYIEDLYSTKEAAEEDMADMVAGTDSSPEDYRVVESTTPADDNLC